MSLKDSLISRIRQVSDDWVPGVKSSLADRMEHIRTRMDALNCSLASKALPEGRRERVRDLVLDQKAMLAAGSRKVVGGHRGRKV
ncbi:hypothetical protein [Marinobacter zhejiangensis]|uniref:Uncharacterized protein n=1 Tax=Marinobacter zhejiangensis TaxID=488535 RepID=A0A1I4QSE3_9GAMM|nr:hypothetical protein [Marinobacter zhejiangensis]SFM42961.1 hypothetical protein SAMN04487963_2552 [Marinobacter zhejiangensis]